MRTVDGVNVHDGYHFCKTCGWIGKELRENGSISYGETWYECPKCGEESANMDLAKAN
jgi:hypothetical protein